MKQLSAMADWAYDSKEAILGAWDFVTYVFIAPLMPPRVACLMVGHKMPMAGSETFDSTCPRCGKKEAW